MQKRSHLQNRHHYEKKQLQSGLHKQSTSPKDNFELKQLTIKQVVYSRQRQISTVIAEKATPIRTTQVVVHVDGGNYKTRSGLQKVRQIQPEERHK